MMSPEPSGALRVWTPWQILVWPVYVASYHHPRHILHGERLQILVPTITLHLAKKPTHLI